MRKIILMMVAIVATIIAGTSVASAQNQSRFSWGPKVGMNVASMTGSVQLDGKPTIGLTAGMFVEYRTCNLFAVSVDVLYSRQGVEFEAPRYQLDQLFSAEYKQRLKNDYLNVPVLANFYVTENLSLKTGVQFGFLMGATVIDGEITKDTKDHFTTTDIAIPFGISYNVGSIVMEARYNLGVTSVFTEQAVASDEAKANTKNHVFQISVGYRF